MSAAVIFSPRKFLKERNALLVHFNTPMSEHETGFPEDIRNAMTLRGVPISFSTIQAGDLGPCNISPASAANAGGSVGMVVDILDMGSVVSVGPADDGTRASKSGHHQTGGSPPNAASCARSIDDRESANEWFVQDYTPRGIFLFLPAMVFVRSSTEQGERLIQIPEILANFLDQRLFAAFSGSFHEFDRGSSKWRSVNYGEIVPP